MEELLVTPKNPWLIALKSPKTIMQTITKRIYRLCGDETYLKKWFEINIGYKPDFNNPKTFNEKLNWLKLHDHNPIYHTLVDKYEVKSIVGQKIGSDFIVPCYGVWDDFDDIDFKMLPNSFVLKPTNFGYPIVVKNKQNLNLFATKKYFEKCKKYDIYKYTKEWGYKDVKFRILADKFLDDKSMNNKLQDYKFWCFNGSPKIMYITIKDNHVYENFYDMDFNPLQINHGFPRFSPEFEKPKQFDKMIELASKLSKGIPFVRIDFFCVNNHVYFGEYTFYDWGGRMPFATYEQDLELGNMIDLHRVEKKKNTETALITKGNY